MTIPHSIEPIWNVFIVGLIFGAGLPLLFSLGIRSLHIGSTDTSGNVRTTPAGKALGGFFFAVAAVVILAGILLVCQTSIRHYTGWDPLPFMSK